ncbi:MAG: hypothetical protein FWG98_03645 [Candidatus Cloacimonetes bacterium]|nr:hypothetical protein [Candidatus Cloacimonadota bacterium]
MAIKKLKTTSKMLVFLLILILCVSQLFGGARAHRIDDDSLKVRNLQVLDLSDDDGSGVRIQWEPLPFEARVISYRVYRGVSPDSLFYIGELPVNPRIGVTTPTMSFYDRNFNIFTNIASPGRLRRERGQPNDSPLFRALPRDVNIIGPMLNQYTILGVIPKDNFYFKTTHVEHEDRVFAGIKPNQLTLAKKLIPGNTYYYSVVAVNERRVFFPPAEPVAGIPIDNAPEAPRYLNGVLISDNTSETDIRDANLQFEWDVPVYWDDIRFFVIHAVSPEREAEYAAWKSEMTSWQNDYEEWIAGLVPNANLPIGSEEKKQYITERTQEFHTAHREIVSRLPATRIWRFTLPQPFTPPTYASIPIVDNQIIGTQERDTWSNHTFDYTFTEPISAYKFVLSYMDYVNLSSFSDLHEIRVMNNSSIPVMDEITIRDQKNDRGDYLELLWGKPFARITSVTYLNESRTNLQMSYEYSTNDNYKIRNIFFEISDDNGRVLATVNEFFQDELFKVKGLPEGTGDLNVRMWFRTNHGEDREHHLTQRLVFDEGILTLRPQQLFFHGFNIDDFNFQIHKRTSFYNSFRMSTRIPLFSRQTNDFINYEVNISKAVANYSAERGLFLVDPNIDLVWDEEARLHVQVPMFTDEVPKILEAIQKSIDEQQELYDNAETEEERNTAQSRIDFFTTRLETMETILQNNEYVHQVNNISNQRTRARAIRRIRENERRYFTYQMFLSDGKGLFTLKDITIDDYGKPIFMIPHSNWFHTQRIPMLVASLIFGLMVAIFVKLARQGKDLYIRPIAGIEEIDNAIGRATEMGRPILFCPGLSGIGDVATLAGLAILGRVAKKAAEYDTKILVPNRDNIVLPIAQEIVREAHYEAGRPDSFDKNNVFFVSGEQFAYVAGVNGVMVREKTATNFYMGMFFAESLIMTETGNATGAIQIAGTDAVTQIPFFITTCDYTLIGEELYAASAYMARQPLQLGTLKAQDYYKFLILIFLVFGTLFSTFQVTAIIDMFPSR